MPQPSITGVGVGSASARGLLGRHQTKTAPGREAAASGVASAPVFFRYAGETFPAPAVEVSGSLAIASPPLADTDASMALLTNDENSRPSQQSDGVGGSCSTINPSAAHEQAALSAVALPPTMPTLAAIATIPEHVPPAQSDANGRSATADPVLHTAAGGVAVPPFHVAPHLPAVISAPLAALAGVSDQSLTSPLQVPVCTGTPSAGATATGNSTEGTAPAIQFPHARSPRDAPVGLATPVSSSAGAEPEEAIAGPGPLPLPSPQQYLGNTPSPLGTLEARLQREIADLDGTLARGTVLNAGMGIRAGLAHSRVAEGGAALDEEETMSTACTANEVRTITARDEHLA